VVRVVLLLNQAHEKPEEATQEHKDKSDNELQSVVSLRLADDTSDGKSREHADHGSGRGRELG
jgi:hypothetical protein